MATSPTSAGAKRSRTYFPSAEAELDATRFATMLESMTSASDPRPALVGPHNEHIPLPAEAFDVLVQVFEAMKQGLAVHVAPLNAQLTTQEAADYLGVSRPTVVKLLESGKISFIKPARHRYVRLDDLVEYAEGLRSQRTASLDALAREAERDALYDDLDAPPPPMR